MIIRNRDKRVIVLKAKDMPKLRLFPGPNKVPKDDYEKYFKTDVAKAYLKESLSLSASKDLSANEKALADEFKRRNEKLNKGQKVKVA
jgi:hypothetical protein